MFEKILPPGKIGLSVPRYDYISGEEISGKVTLKADKSIKARGLYVRLYEKRKTTSFSGGRRTSSHRMVAVFEKPLDGEREYSGEKSYDFRFQLPIVAKTPDILKGVVEVFSAVTGITGRRFYIKATLDIPGGADINSKQYEITVAPRG